MGLFNHDIFTGITDARKKLILDCDPGHDDAVALLLALGAKNIDLLGVTCVGGNQTLEKVAYNARSILEKAKATDIPVYAGCARPLVRKSESCPSIHGKSGLDGAKLPKPSRPLEKLHAVEFIIQTIMENKPKTITLVPTGPLTNIALACRLEPKIVDRVKEVVLMGGSASVGNWSASAEYNIWEDPEAAHIVFNEAWPLTMVGLDLTHQALITNDVAARIEAIGSDVSDFVLSFLNFYRKTYKATMNMDAAPLHDPCAMAYVINPEVIKCVKAPIDIELSGNLTAGETIVDLRANTKITKNVHTQVAFKLDVEAFWDMVIDAISNL